MVVLTAQPIRLPALALVAALAAVLVACGGSPAQSSAAASQGASQAGSGRCAVASDATATATIEQVGTQFEGEADIAAGEAVEFTNQASVGHTVTEGTDGQAAADACVNESLSPGSSVLVVFEEAGEYQITCRIHSSMRTVVRVE